MTRAGGAIFLVGFALLVFVGGAYLLGFVSHDTLMVWGIYVSMALMFLGEILITVKHKDTDD